MAKRTILFAEDSSVIQNVSRKVFAFQDFNVEFAKTGKDVVEYMKNNDCDIVVMDVVMPEMDGVEALAEIRKMSGNKAKTPVIAFTGNAKGYTDEEFKEMGFDDFVIKPIDFDVLIRKIDALTGVSA
jgi:CheY-like chemotaxis protein